MQKIEDSKIEVHGICYEVMSKQCEDLTWHVYYTDEGLVMLVNWLLNKYCIVL